MCCLEFALALMLAISPVQLRAECAEIRCQQQAGWDCMSAAGAMQVAEHIGQTLRAPARWDWAEVDAHIWSGVALFAWPWADANWTPDGLAHAFYCDGDAWIAPLRLRIMHCYDTDNPAGTWWSVPWMQHTWTGWSVVRE